MLLRQRVWLRRAVRLPQPVWLQQRLNNNVSTASTEENALVGLTPDVIKQLVDSHARFLAFVQRRVGSRATAEDILQEAFARALARGESLRSDESAVAWFYRLLRNALVDHHRRSTAATRALGAAALEPEAPAPGPDSELMATVCECVGDLVGTLKPEYADAIRSVDLNEGSVGDYAQAAGITANNAGVRLHRAREALMRSLVRSCGTCAAHGCLDCSCQKTASQPGGCSPTASRT
jgi:RNA polymerase sigma-70 factor (ECF subfamily)